MEPTSRPELAAALELPSLETTLARIAELPPGEQCAVLGHPYPQTWQVAVDVAGGRDVAYYHWTCPRCSSIEVTNGWSWPL